MSQGSVKNLPRLITVIMGPHHARTLPFENNYTTRQVRYSTGEAHSKSPIVDSRGLVGTALRSWQIAPGKDSSLAKLKRAPPHQAAAPTEASVCAQSPLAAQGRVYSETAHADVQHHPILTRNRSLSSRTVAARAVPDSSA